MAPASPTRAAAGGVLGLAWGWCQPSACVLAGNAPASAIHAPTALTRLEG